VLLYQLSICHCLLCTPWFPHYTNTNILIINTLINAIHCYNPIIAQSGSTACTLSSLKVHIWKCFQFIEYVSGMRKPERLKTALAPQKAPARSPPLKHEGACDLALIVLGEGTEGTLLYKPHPTLMSPSGSKSGLLSNTGGSNPLPRAAHMPKSCVSSLWLTRSSRIYLASRGCEPKQL